MITDEYRVIDVDTHISEPSNLWTSRVSVKKWGEKVPYVYWDEENQKDRWRFGGAPLPEKKKVEKPKPSGPKELPDDTSAMFLDAAAGPAFAGWSKFPPEHPPTLKEADPACYEPHARLKRMDEFGIHAQVLYPNVGGLAARSFLNLNEPELMLECVRAYNDFQSDFAAVDRKRFIPIVVLPFWDLEASVKEVERCAKMGHKGVVMASEPKVVGQPYLADPFWNPLWEKAQDLELPISFHIGSDLSWVNPGYPGTRRRLTYAKQSVGIIMDNWQPITELIVSGICHRYPKLNFVSVESGVGWIPFVLSALEWQWDNNGCFKDHPERLRPIEYFRRQIYSCSWFETDTLAPAVNYIGADNVLYETDFPHPTSMTPGPASTAQSPKDYIEHVYSKFPKDQTRKILHDNAARLYKMD